MSRLTYLAALTMALLALTASVQAADPQKCEPIHTLYKEWVSTCTNNNQAIPHSDADPRWKPCICRDGFFPLAIAAENCQNDNSGVNQLTPDALAALCNGTPGFVAASQQKANAELVKALAQVTSISAAQPAPTGSPSGGDSAASSLLAGSSPALLYTTVMTMALIAAGFAF